MRHQYFFSSNPQEILVGRQVWEPPVQPLCVFRTSGPGLGPLFPQRTPPPLMVTTPSSCPVPTKSSPVLNTPVCWAPSCPSRPSAPLVSPCSGSGGGGGHWAYTRGGGPETGRCPVSAASPSLGFPACEMGVMAGPGPGSSQSVPPAIRGRSGLRLARRTSWSGRQLAASCTGACAACCWRAR